MPPKPPTAAEESGRPHFMGPRPVSASGWSSASIPLAPGGRVVIAHYDWLPLEGNVVAETERMIVGFNPGWRLGGGAGIHPAWLTDLGLAGFREIETFSYDVAAVYRREAWIGRIRASAGIVALDELARAGRPARRPAPRRSARDPAPRLGGRGARPAQRNEPD